MEQAEKIMDARTRIFEQYLSLLRPLEEKGAIRLPSSKSWNNSNGHIFYTITRSLEERGRLINYLKQNGIMAIFHYVPLHSSPAGERYGRVHGSLEVTNDQSKRLVRLPLWYGLSEQQQGRVVDVLKRAGDFLG